MFCLNKNGRGRKDDNPRGTRYFSWLVLLFLFGCGSGGGGTSSSASDSELATTRAAQLMFTPQEEGVVIGIQNPDEFEDMTSFVILATDQTRERVRRQDVVLTELGGSGYHLTGLTNGASYRFSFLAIYGEGEIQLIPISFIWYENDMDHSNGGIAIGINTDRDPLANMVDSDDDNDGVWDEDDNCQFVFNPDQRNTDGAADGGDACDDDDDNDLVADEEDIDLDGDGLIEIASAEELDAIRYALNASGRRLGPDATLNRAGCGNNNTVTSCRGYELTTDIDLASYINDVYGDEGWLPLGENLYDDDDSCEGEGFNGIFEGNNFTISNLRIMRPQLNCQGLFGRLRGEVRHLTVMADEIHGNNNVGGLAGDGESARIVSSSTTITSLRGYSYVGGLIGGGDNVTMVSSSVTINTIGGRSNAGGLLGGGDYATVVSSSAVINILIGAYRAGGLIGDGDYAEVVSSSVVASSLGEGDYVGGLIGDGRSVRIISSSAVLTSISGDSNIGGLIGYGRDGKIVSSYASFSLLRGEGDCLGGLIGNGRSATINASYALFDLLNGDDDVGGLMGDGRFAKVVSSYVMADSLSGDSAIGGLIGGADSAEIISSYVMVDSFSGRNSIGGLTGDGRSVKVVSSYVMADSFSGNDDVGGLVGDGDTAAILSSYAMIDSLSGYNRVGGMIGGGEDMAIDSSYVIAGLINGESSIGGMVGDGEGGVINASYAITGLVEGDSQIGGLVGYGNSITIASSSSISNIVDGYFEVGGLIGDGGSARIVSSYAIAGSLNGEAIGGLIGDGDSAGIVSSYAVVGILAGINLGGLIGKGDSAMIISSYAVGLPRGDNAYGLVGIGEGVYERFSYWDSDIGGIGRFGSSQTSVALQQPTDYHGIYVNWTMGIDIDDISNGTSSEVDNITVWCDENLSGDVEEEEKTDDNRIWDFGTPNEYPAIRCSPITVAEQRSWWFVNEMSMPQLNQTRLDELLP